MLVQLFFKNICKKEAPLICHHGCYEIQLAYKLQDLIEVTTYVNFWFLSMLISMLCVLRILLWPCEAHVRFC
uniref:Uncharacterized protein n=1 Tax=Setaria italica TaxID=4555 RepID=K4AHM1_SETIT